jgi:hypothetical protein
LIAPIYERKVEPRKNPFCFKSFPTKGCLPKEFLPVIRLVPRIAHLITAPSASPRRDLIARQPKAFARAQAQHCREE